jgi:hypothetical protein
MDPQYPSDAAPAAGLPTRPVARTRGRRLPKRRAALAALALIALLVVAGVAGSLRQGAGLAGLPMPGPRAVAGDVPRDGLTLQNAYAVEAAATAAPAAPASGGAGSGAGSAATAPWDRKIIRTGTINLQVTDVEAALATVRDIADGAQGLVFSSTTQYQGDDLMATVTIQVPADTFDTVMSRLRHAAVKVLSENSTSQDVTEEYTDLGSQLKNLQAQEEQLRALVARATNVNDTLAVGRELSGVRGQIEQIQGRLNYLSHRSELSTITIALQPKPAAVAAAPAPGWQPAATAAAAWVASLALLTQVADGLIALVVFFWWTIPLALLAAVIVRARRRSQPGLAG